MTRLLKSIALLLLLGLGTAGYTQVMLRKGSGTPPPMAPAEQQADAIHVDKSDRQLTLLRDGTPIKTYDISMGGAPEGHKTQEGDERTPTGNYVIDWRNDSSIAHLSLTAFSTAGGFWDHCKAIGIGQTAALQSPTQKCAKSGRWCLMAHRSKSRNNGMTPELTVLALAGLLCHPATPAEWTNQWLNSSVTKPVVWYVP